MATLRQAIIDARNALVNYTPLTDLISADKITFGNSPQKDAMPRIVLEVSGVEYQPTFDEARKVQVFQMDFGVYSKTVDQCTAIMDEVRYALEAYTSADFSIRLVDETFQADVDNNLFGVIFAEFTDAVGDTNTNVAGTGKSVAELAAQDAVNTTDQTVEELVNFYITETDDTIKYNTAGQPGEGATHLYGTEWLADGYTGPVLQMFDAQSHDGSGTINGYDTVDVYPNTLHLYTVSATSVINTAEDGKRWRVLKVYDQVGNNDLVYDATEAFNEDGVWPQVGPMLTYYEGAYLISRVESPHGLLSESGAQTNPITVVCEVNTIPGRKMTFGAQSLNASGEDKQQPYSSWGFANWNGTNYDGQGVNVWHGPAPNSDSFTPYAQINAVTNVQDADRLVQTSGGRETYALSRQDTEGRSYDGSNTYADTADTFTAASFVPGQSLKFGFGQANYNNTNGLNEGFYSLAIHAGRFVDDTADLKSLADSFTKQNGHMTHRDRFTKNQ